METRLAGGWDGQRKTGNEVVGGASGRLVIGSRWTRRGVQERFTGRG
jgi:hypothetical protein